MDQLCIDKGLGDFGCSIVSFGLYFSYFLIGAALILAIVLPLMSAIKNPKVLTKIGISIAILVGVFLLAFIISSDQVSDIAKSKGIGSMESQVIGAGFIMFYFALIAAVLGLIYSEISKAFR